MTNTGPNLNEAVDSRIDRRLGVETPSEETIEAIDTILQQPGSHYIRLKPTLYEGETSIELDLYGETGGERAIFIDARGAGVNYTGEGKGLLDIYQNKGVPDSWDGTIELIGGSWYGPGSDVEDSYSIRGNDLFRGVLRPSDARDAENGVLVRNHEQWSEAGHYGTLRSHEYCGGDVQSDRATNLIRFAAGESDYPGTNGTQSFRCADITVPWGMGAHGGGKTVWLDGAVAWGSRIEVRGFVPDDGVHLHIDNGGGDRTGHVFFEGENGSEDSIGFLCETDIPPIVEHFETSVIPGPDVVNNGVGTIPYHDNQGLRALGEDGHRTGGTDRLVDTTGGTVSMPTVVSHPPGGKDGYGYVGYRMKNSDGSDRFTIRRSPDDGAITFEVDDAPLRVADVDNALEEMAVSELRLGESGGRIYLNDDGDLVADDANGGTVNLSRLSTASM